MAGRFLRALSSCVSSAHHLVAVPRLRFNSLELYLLGSNKNQRVEMTNPLLARDSAQRGVHPCLCNKEQERIIFSKSRRKCGVRDLLRFLRLARARAEL